MTVATPHTACVSEATGDDSETQEDASCLPKMPSFMFGQSMDPEVLAVRPVWDINVWASQKTQGNIKHSLKM